MCVCVIQSKVLISDKGMTLRANKKLSCTTPSLTGVPPSCDAVAGFSEISTDLLCTEEEIRSYLLALDATKARGSDGLSAKMLEGTAASIAPAGILEYGSPMTSAGLNK